MIGANVLWDPTICRSIIPVISMKASVASQASLSRLPEDTKIFVFTPCAGFEHVSLRRDRNSVQLAVQGATILSNCRLLTELKIGSGKEHKMLEAMGRFNALFGEKRSAFDGSRDEHRADERLRLVLLALDGYLAGLSQREIAELTFGPHRVSRDWRDGSSLMRDRVRRAIKRGRRLMTRDYIALLR